MFQTSLGVLLSGEITVVGETEWVGGSAVGSCFCKETENEKSSLKASRTLACQQRVVK